jgi:hypothetical protein
VNASTDNPVSTRSRTENNTNGQEVSRHLSSPFKLCAVLLRVFCGNLLTTFNFKVQVCVNGIKGCGPND